MSEKFTKEELELFWEPVKTKEELKEHIKTFLDIEFPDQIIDEESTSTPLDFIWDVYSYMTTNKGYSRHVVAASRNSFKTLTTAVLQFYNLIHCRRDAVQISAELQQSASALAYVEFFLKRPLLEPYGDKDNTKIKKLTNLPIEYNWLTKRKDVVLKVVTATKKGANSSRASCLSGKTQILVYTDKKQPNGFNYTSITLHDLYLRMQKGEKIKALTINPKTLEPVYSDIIAIQKRIEQERLVIEIDDQKIEATKEHLFAYKWENGKFLFKRADELKPEDTIIVKNKKNFEIKTQKIKNITPKIVSNTKIEKWVYDIQIQETNTFFANNIFLVHNCMIYDETDLTPLEVLGEAAYIADVERYTGFDPVSVYISSRKSNDGPLQALIDEYENKKPNDLKLHKWSLVDTMKRCPEEVCDSTKPATAFMHMEKLEVIWGEDRFDSLVKEGKEVWKRIEAYEDCAKCPAFIACQGRSKKQTKDYKTLRTHTFVGNLLKNVMSTGGPSAIVSQMLNLKPETSSVVFSVFNPTKNVLKNIEFYKWVAGHYYNPLKLLPEDLQKIIDSKDEIQMQTITPSKQDIYNYMTKNGWIFHCGVDWGLYDPAVALLVGYHKASRRAAILHIEASSGYPNEDWAKYIANNIYNIMPFDMACPDMADPSSPTYFARLKIPSLNTKPSKIETGVNQIKSLIFNPFTQKSHLMILDDGEFGQNKMLIEALSKWTYQKNATGYNYSKFEDNEYTHTIDALRYALAPFIEDNTTKFSSHQGPSEANLSEKAATGDKEALEMIRKKEEFMSQFNAYMMQEHGFKEPIKPPSEVINNKPKKSGSVKFKI
jgi:hypothetical protein